MLKIQKRDQELLKLCYEQQFLLIEQIEDFFFSHCTRQKARQRVNELEQFGYLLHLKDPIFGQRKIIRITRRGEELARSQSHLEIPQLRRLNAATLIHDSIVTSVRMRLASVWPEAHFVPERAIKKLDLPQIPDGVFYFPSGNGIAIEVENSAKGKKRFCTLMKRWNGVPSIIFVLYIATTPGLNRCIQTYLPFAPLDQPMGTVDWSTLKTAFPEVWTPQGNVPLFGRRDY
ncbi:hypothetical protein WDW37_16505 [Bdellovibrionota bacterium FG-1]